MEEDGENGILNAILIACVIGIIVVVGLIVFYPRPSDAFTAIYFVNGTQYTKAPIDGKVYFNFTIENHEGKESDYLVEYLIDNSTFNYEDVEVGKGMNISLSRSLTMQDINETHKIGIMLNSNPDYEIHFWTKV